jgi:phage baseplate assembly protein V
MNTAEILRLLSNLLRIGYVDEIDYDARKVRVTSGENTTDWISWKVDRAGTTQTWDPPTLGEQVLLASPEGELNNAIVRTPPPVIRTSTSACTRTARVSNTTSDPASSWLPASTPPCCRSTS